MKTIHVTVPARVRAIDLDEYDIASVYVGKTGCRCGCLGSYKYPSDPELRYRASKRRGYDITDDEVSDRSIENAMKLLLDTPYQEIECFDGDSLKEPILEVKTGKDRVRTIYLTKKGFIK